MENFQSYVASGYPIIAVQTDDELTVVETIKSSLNGKPIYFWDIIDPGADLRYPQIDFFQYGDGSLETYLEQWAYWKDGKDCIIVLHNYSCHQSDRSNSILRKIAQTDLVRAFRLTFILFVQEPNLSPMIAPFSVISYVKPADKDFIISELKSYSSKYNLEILENYINQISYLFNGLTKFEIRLVLNRLVHELKESEQSDRLAEKIRKYRKPFIDKYKLLKIVDDKNSMNEVGGFDNFKKYLQSKRKIIQDLDKAKTVGIDFPKGVLLVGEPGCGKSLVCKATAKYFELPLLRLDIGMILGKYLGESESNFEKMLILAENYSPCVLWIDELEKAFSGSNSSSSGSTSDVIMRLMGIFLTWLQDHDSNVYVMATANDISILPKELFRKGRFDEIFYAGKPKNQREALEIFNIHLQKRGHERFALERRYRNSYAHKELYKKAHDNLEWSLSGLTGAEIENEVKLRLERWFNKSSANFLEFLLKEDLNSHPYIEKQSKHSKDENRLKAEGLGARMV